VRVLITTGIYPPAIGGPATHIAQIARELVRRGHDVAVVTLAEGPAIDTPGIIRIRRGAFLLSRMARTVAAIARAARGRDLLYVQGLWIEAAIANLILRKPIVRKIVGDWAWERAYGRGWVNDSFDAFQRRPHAGRIGLLKWLRAALTRLADRVVVPSDYLRECVRGWGVPDARIEVIPNAIDPPAAAAIDEPRIANRVIAVGRLARWKGLEQIIVAIEAVADAHLVVVGDGPERQRLEACARAGAAADRVQWRGRLSQAHVIAELSVASCFVLNSAYEGFPHVVLEAFAAGTPVIAGDAGGIAEIIRDGENGLLVRQGDTAAIARAIQRVLGDVTLAARLCEGGRRSLERYTQAGMVDRLEQSLIRVCGAPPTVVAAI
jgi:glycosyltransferase involved in cell wall biosynthesis